MGKKYGMIAASVALFCSMMTACSVDSTTPPASTVKNQTPVTVTETVPAPSSPALSTPPAYQPAPPDPCNKGWDTSPDATETQLVRGSIVSVRYGRHDDNCFDRMVIEVATTEQVGFHVQYVDVVRHDGSGTPVPVAGSATLQVAVDAPSATPLTPSVFHWSALREVRSAGSFEGMSTYAVGVAAKTPFAVYHQPTNNGHMLVIIDITYR